MADPAVATAIRSLISSEASVAGRVNAAGGKLSGANLTVASVVRAIIIAPLYMENQYRPCYSSSSPLSRQEPKDADCAGRVYSVPNFWSVPSTLTGLAMGDTVILHCH